MLSQKLDPLQYLIDNVSAASIVTNTALVNGHFPNASNQSAKTVNFKGKSSVVFAFQLQKKLKALKIWPAADMEQRRMHYTSIKENIANNKLTFFAPFVYMENAIVLNDVKHDALLMDWVGRQNLKEYIRANIDKPDAIDALAEKLLRMHGALNKAGIAHGHLHPGNIYVDANDELKLIGYDNLNCGEGQRYFGEVSTYPDYSHPTMNVQGAKADYFAALVLYLGIKALAQDNVLWGRYKIGYNEGFVFSTNDFLNLNASPVYQWLRKKKWPEVDKLLDALDTYCEADSAEKLVPFYELLGDSQALLVNEESEQPVSDYIEVNEMIPSVSDGTAADNKEIVIEDTPAIINVQKKNEANDNDAVAHSLIVVSSPEKKTPVESIYIENNNETNAHVLSVVDQSNVVLYKEERSAQADAPVIRFLKKRKLLIAVMALLTVCISSIVTYLINAGPVDQHAQEYVTQKEQESDKGIDDGSVRVSTIPSSTKLTKDAALLSDSAQLNKPADKATAVNIVESPDSNKLLLDVNRKDAVATNSASDQIKKGAEGNTPTAQTSIATTKTGIDSSLAIAGKARAVINENNNNRQGNIALRKIKGQNENASFSIGEPPKE